MIYLQIKLIGTPTASEKEMKTRNLSYCLKSDGFNDGQCDRISKRWLHS
jgi:hypothetical protein